MNTILPAIFIIAALALIVSLFVRNQKDKKALIDKLNNDYRKTKDEENDADAEETTK
jgi:FtsZ-interacting cell division protein ZipA